MEFWPKRKVAVREDGMESPKLHESEPAALPELELSKEQELKGDFESISSPEEFIAAVDFKTLNEIFDRLVKRSGGDGEVKNTGHRVTPENIQFISKPEKDEERTLNGSARVRTGEIELAWSFSTGDITSPPKVMQLLKTLFHEAVHVRGGYSNEVISEDFTPEEPDEWSTTFKTKVGLREYTHTYVGDAIEPLEVDHGINLNEAVTEDIAQRVLQEYLLRTGNGVYLKDPQTLHELEYAAYGAERLALKCLIHVAAEQLGISEGVFWQGVVQAYLSGNHDLLLLMQDITEEVNSNPQALELIRGLTLDGDMGKIVSTDVALGALGTLIELPALDFTKDPEPQVEAFLKQLLINQRHLDALDSLGFKAKIGDDDLGLRK